MKVTTAACKALSVVLPTAAALAAAQSYPNKPVRFSLGFAAASTNDSVARALARKLTQNMGQSVVVENRGGANTAIATEVAVRAASYGYKTLLYAPGIKDE